MTTPMTETQKEHYASQYALKLGPWLRFAVDQGDADLVESLIGNLDQQHLMVLAVVLAADGPAPASRPDDGLVDEVAIQRVISGHRVPLSPLEQSIAVKELHRRDVPRGEIMERLGLSQKRYRTLLAAPVQPSLFEGEPEELAGEQGRVAS